MKKGVVVGKFYPLHRGHNYLIDTAIKNVDQLSVLVCTTKDQFIPGEKRVEWIKELHPKANVILVDDNIPEAGMTAEEYSKAWADYTIKVLGYVPDVAFTSEEYGARWAKYMGCQHYLVDMNRKKIPCSGTMVRSNPLKYLDYLEEPVRAYFVKRVCILGAESTGTTTIAKALAKHYETNWVPEYGREYSEAKLYNKGGNKWKTKEFIEIATEQNRREDLLARTANKILICDTDSFATGVWHERYMDKRSKEVEKLSDSRKYDIYFLTDVDIPFVQDSTRDGKHVRTWVHKLFIKRLKERNKKFYTLSGTRKQRLGEAVKIVDKEFFAKN